MGRTKKAGQAKAAADAAAKAADDGPSTSYDATLPSNLELARTRVVCGTDMNLHVSPSTGVAAAAVAGRVLTPPCMVACCRRRRQPPPAAAACCRSGCGIAIGVLAMGRNHPQFTWLMGRADIMWSRCRAVQRWCPLACHCCCPSPLCPPPFQHAPFVRNVIAGLPALPWEDLNLTCCFAGRAVPCCSQTTSTIAASQWGSLGVDASFDMASFKKGFSIDIKRYEGDDMEFEMKGVSCAVRRAGEPGAAGRVHYLPVHHTPAKQVTQ